MLINKSLEISEKVPKSLKRACNSFSELSFFPVLFLNDFRSFLFHNETMPNR